MKFKFNVLESVLDLMVNLIHLNFKAMTPHN